MITASRHLMDNILCSHAIQSDEKCKISSRETFFHLLSIVSQSCRPGDGVCQCTSEVVSRGIPRPRTSVTLVFGGWRLPRRKERRDGGLIEIAGTPFSCHLQKGKQNHRERQADHFCI